MKTAYLPIYVIVCLVTMTACSHKQAYHAAQEMGKSMAKCELIADHLAQQRCFAQFDKSYETYQQEREQVINQNK